METLVVVAQHQDQYGSRRRVHGSARCGSFVSPPIGGYKEVKYRVFPQEAGILRTPAKTPTGNKRASSNLQKTPSPSVRKSQSGVSVSKQLKGGGAVKTSATTITPIRISFKADDTNKKGVFGHRCSGSELWAGPAYSYSPPPSSLPIPSFSVRPKRSVSLTLPDRVVSDLDLNLAAKSAPSSPTSDLSKCSSGELFYSADSATKTLRRILNLDIADD